MSVRTTVDIPDELHRILADQAQRTGTSIRSLVVRALEDAYTAPRKGEYVTAPLVTLGSDPGPDFPVDENPYDLVFP